MKSFILRILEIVSGIVLILVGIVLLVTPGPGIVLIAGGIFLISPYHGKRMWRRMLRWKKETLDSRLSRFRKK